MIGRYLEEECSISIAFGRTDEQTWPETYSFHVRGLKGRVHSFFSRPVFRVPDANMTLCLLHLRKCTIVPLDGCPVGLLCTLLGCFVKLSAV